MVVQYDRICPICENDLKYDVRFGVNNEIIIRCDCCGKYAMSAEFYEDYIEAGQQGISRSKIASYLYYHKRYATAPCICHSQRAILRGYRCTTLHEIQNWYPKKFNEKVDTFLLGLGDYANYMSEAIEFSEAELASACFVNRNIDCDPSMHSGKIKNQISFLINYLEKLEYIVADPQRCVILPKGLERIDTLQGNARHSTKNVFIAMSFAPEMLNVRDAIKAAISECGFSPRIMDEIEHNHQIVPEMLHEIRDSRFVVAELTGHNNGAYFEAGYALGYGKEVIHICEKSKFGTDGHFDVKQVNTILWENTNDLTNRLIARIKATIT